MNLTDLFGLERALTPKERSKLTKRHSTTPRGYYLPPGTGPAGETCGSCKHLFRNRMSKTYVKCKLNEGRWTGGPGSDVRSKSPACKAWEAK